MVHPVTEKRRYEEKADKSRYQEDPDIGAGMQGQRQETDQGAGRQRERIVEVRQEDRPDTGAAQQARPDITARLRRNPDIIMSETVANRPSRQRKQTVVYQAGGKRKRDRK